jgi:hypothetical protein
MIRVLAHIMVCLAAVLLLGGCSPWSSGPSIPAIPHTSLDGDSGEVQAEKGDSARTNRRPGPRQNSRARAVPRPRPEAAS